MHVRVSQHSHGDRRIRATGALQIEIDPATGALRITEDCSGQFTPAGTETRRIVAAFAPSTWTAAELVADEQQQ